MSNQQLNCPKCQQIDKVEKVTSIFSGGVTANTDLSTGLSSGSQSLLSSRLAPPPKPSAEGRSCGALGGSIALWGVGAMWLLIAACTSFEALRAIRFSTPRGSEAIFGLFLFVVFAIIFLGGGTALWLSSGKAVKRREEQVAAQIPKWEKAMERWNKLYYCTRDDVVFDPDEKVYLSPEQMMEQIASYMR